MAQKITRAIIHSIPRGSYDGSTTVELSEADIELHVQTKRFIETKIVSVALQEPRLIVEDGGSGSMTPARVREILQDDQSFVPHSQSLSADLYAAQTGNSPAGIVVVAIVNDDGKRSVLIMKAEHQEGLQLRKNNGVFDLDHLDDLIVGNNARVYKVAILSPAADGAVSGTMVDAQNGDSYAAFFLSKFLGCRLADDSELRTREFVDASMSFIERAGLPIEKRIRYTQAVMAYMHSPLETFQGTQFAEQFLEPGDQARMGGLKMYAPGVVISANALALERGDIEVLDEDGEHVTFKVRGSLTRVALGKAPRMAR